MYVGTLDGVDECCAWLRGVHLQNGTEQKIYFLLFHFWRVGLISFAIYLFAKFLFER